MKRKFTYAIILTALLLSGCGKEEETGSTARATESGITPKTEAVSIAGSEGAYSLGNMTYIAGNVWAGDGVVYGDTVRFELKDSFLILSINSDKGDVSDPELRERYRAGVSANYEAQLSLLDIDSIGGRPALGVSGDIKMSDGVYLLNSYVIKSDHKWYHIQFFQREGEDHQKELKELLDSITFVEAAASSTTYTVGCVEYSVPSDWSGDGVINSSGATYFYPEYGMLMVEQKSLSEDLSSPEVQASLMQDFNGDMESGGIAITNTYLIDNHYALAASGECVVKGSKMWISAVYLQVKDTVYNFSMGVFEDHYTDYDAETEAIFASIRVDEQAASTESTKPTESTEGNEGSGISAEFKETMDSYEAFFDKYVEYLKQFQGEYDPAIQSEYTEFMESYNDVIAKFHQIDIQKLTPEESAYYNEVMTRVSEKLAEAEQH